MFRKALSITIILVMLLVVSVVPAAAQTTSPGYYCYVTETSSGFPTTVCINYQIYEELMYMGIVAAICVLSGVCFI